MICMETRDASDKGAKGKEDPPIESQGSEWTSSPNLALDVIFLCLKDLSST